MARDVTIPKNSFEGPSYENLDVRLAKFFAFGGNRRLTLIAEFFNVTNEQNAAL